MWGFLLIGPMKMSQTALLSDVAADIENGTGCFDIRHENSYWYADVGFSFLGGR